MAKQKNEFKDAEALGHIKTMPEYTEPKMADTPGEDVIDDPDSFRMAVAHAQMEGIDHVIVTEKVMKYLLRGHKGVSLTYGDPGVRVYLQGTKEDLDRKEKLSAEAFHEQYMAEMRGERIERERSGKI